MELDVLTLRHDFHEPQLEELPMSRRMFICKIVQFVGPGTRWLHFIGPSIDHIPAGWSIKFRKVAR